MAKYRIKSPDGQTYEVTAPDTASESEVLAYAQQQFSQQSQADFSNVQSGASTSEAPTQGRTADTGIGRLIAGKRQQGNAVGRALGEVGGRQVLQGVLGTFGALGGDAVNQTILAPIDRAIGWGNQLGVGDQTYREAASGLADRMGMRAPQTSGERVMSDVAEGLSGTAATMGLGSLLNAGRSAVSTVAPTIRSRIGDFLTAQPKLQMLSTVTGAGASSAAREGGAGTGGQLAAGLAGGLTPGALSTAGAATIRGLVRGTSGEQMANQIQNFGRVGSTPSVGQASGNRTIQGIESLLAAAPTSTGVMTRFAERQADDIGRSLQSQADAFAPKASAERAGRAIERGIHGPDGFTSQFKNTQERLFNELDNFIPQDRRIQVSNTRNAISSLNAPIPRAPNVSEFFKNARIQGVGNALERDLGIPTDAQKALDDALLQIDSLYASRDAAIQEMGKFRSFANDQANRTNRFYPVEGQPRFPGRYSPFPARSSEAMEAASEAGTAALDKISRAQKIESTLGQLQAAADATNGRLPYEAIKKLRTLVGQEIDNAGLMSDFPRDKWKALYSALSRDLEVAAGEAGPQAMQAFKRANNYTRAGMDRVETISRVVDKNGGPEKVFNAVMAGTRDGGTTLRAVMQSLPKDGQKAVTAAVIKRMGLATPGAQDAAGETFSAQTFLTNWNKVSQEAKKALFDRYGPGFSKHMDRIANVAENIRDGAKVYANPSGSANKAAAYTYGAALIASLFDPSLVSTGGLVGGGVSANWLSRKLTDPEFVRLLANSTAFPTGSIMGQINALRGLGERQGDEETIAVADALAREHAVDEQANAANRQ